MPGLTDGFRGRTHDWYRTVIWANCIACNLDYLSVAAVQRFMGPAGVRGPH
jgi:hypothetical protein